LQTLADFGVRSVSKVQSCRLFLVDLPFGPGTEDRKVAERVALELLADPVAERWSARRQGDPEPAQREGMLAIEVHLKPGVMDTVAQSTMLALADMGVRATSVRTGRRFELSPIPSDADLHRIPRLLGNDCIEDVVIGTRPIEPPPAPPRYQFSLRHVSLCDLDDAALERLSRQGHLFLSMEEMRTVQAHFRTQGRDPTDLELETIAQTWSEHCVHKTLKSAIVYRGAPMPTLNADKPKRQNAKTEEVELRYGNLLKDTIARATEELMREGRGPKCLSVFKDNAGIIDFDGEYGVAFKVETHNHPSAIEPYGGAATGVGGVIRDVLGCGLGAQPIANTDVFCVAPPDWPVDQVPKGVIHPRTVLKGVVAGVRDYGNRMGIPTVNGAVHFDPRYLGNPLVFCGCVGLIPIDRIEKCARPGDAIVVMGGRTGRDGIHGATFSSAELTDTHEDEFAHAVQIGSAIEEKKVLDVILQARDYVGAEGARTCLFSAITDCGAGGLSSAVGEMAAETGAEVDLEKVPLKYAGLRYDEIWISESQERMVLAVPPENVATLLALAKSEDVEATVIGTFTSTGRLAIRYEGRPVGEIELHFLHEGLPKTERIAEWRPIPATARAAESRPTDLVAELKKRLASPATASKHWIIRQYDHEVRGRTVVRPLVGPGEGPSDAAVIRPRLDSPRGIAIGCGLAPQLADVDPYWMAVAAIDEALRNVVCVGGDPSRTAILDNFCWPRVDDPRNLGALVRACQACYDVSKAYGLPFISGKDSLNNEFALDAGDVELVQAAMQAADRARPTEAIRGGRLAIPYTLLISAVSLIDDVANCVTMDLKQGDEQVFLLGRLATYPPRITAKQDSSLFEPPWPQFDLSIAAQTHQLVAKLIREGIFQSVHDVSDGGAWVALAEMAMAGNRSIELTVMDGWARHQMTGGGFPPVTPFPALPQGWERELAFTHAPGIYLVQLSPGMFSAFVDSLLAAGNLPFFRIAFVKERSDEREPSMYFPRFGGAKAMSVSLRELRTAWQSTLDW
jgi:phosphoribosylformylglycinamidine synthase subunit PurSL